MQGISLLIKPAGSLCNMRCRYCFYREERQDENSGRFLPEETLRAVFEKLLFGVSGPCRIVYQGGEPTLCGLDYFRTAVRLAKAYAAPDATVEHAIQTNGLLIDDAWAEFFAQEHFLVGISLDGPQSLHDKYRVDLSGNGTHARVTKAIRILERHGVAFNILSVITADSCRFGASMYRFFDRSGFLWQQYIPALPPLHSAKPQAWSLTPQAYGAFLKETFRLWYQDVSEGKPVYNRYFDNLVGVLCNRLPEACDMRGFCSPQYVIEADGSVYPCDFYAVEDWLLGNIHSDSAAELQQAAQVFLQSGTVDSSHCRLCKWFTLCRGGCRRRREGRERDLLCEAYRIFFPYAYPKLKDLAEKVRLRQ